MKKCQILPDSAFKTENYELEYYQNALFEQNTENHNNWLRKGFLHCLINLFYKN
jgi:hypothetical protein